MFIDDRFPLVSVIIPVYNVVSFLRQSIESVINQTYKNLEIIIIDDGSSDDSALICDEYQRIDSRIKVIHQDNCGLSAARNVGLDNVSGSVISFLDSDDYLEPYMIEVMLTNLLDYQADIAICSYNIVYNDLNGQDTSQIVPFNFRQGVVSSKEALVLLLDGKINYGVWNKLYRRNVFEKLRFPEGHVYEDNYIIPEAFEKANRLVMISCPLLTYRKRYNSITTTYSDENMLDWLRSRKKLDNFVKERTPTVFSQKQRDHFNEIIFDGLIKHYLDFLVHDSISDTTKDAIQMEIWNRAKYIKSFSFKTKILYYAYEFNPYFCLYLRRFYTKIKNVKRFLVSHPKIGRN